MKSDFRSASDPDRARRRLVRGTFGAPAVLTFASGSALAASSSKCLVNAPATLPTAKAGDIPSTDTYIRVKLRRELDSSGKPIGDFYLFRTDVQALAALYGWGVDSLAFPGLTQMRAWDTSSTSANSYKSGSSDQPENLGFSMRPRLVALRVSYVTSPTTGYMITGVGGVGAGNVASTSCATSLR